MNEDKATLYHRRRRWIELSAMVAAAVVLIAFVVSGAALRLRELAAVIGEALPLLEGDAATVSVFATVLLLVLHVVELPFAFHKEFLLEHRYGLSTQSLRHWMADHAKAGVLSLAFGVTAASVVYALLRWSPDWWWLVSAVLTGIVMVAMTLLAPVLLLPLFYRVSPLGRPALEARLRALGDRAGTCIAGVFEWQVSGHTRKANAALAGLGRTRRILLSDTLLADYSDDEIEVVMAHELSHHVHHDLWRSLGLQSTMIVAGFLFAHLALEAASSAIGLRGQADPAGLPLLLLVWGACALGWLPVSNAASRSHERRADRFALEATANPAAFISAMRRLAQQNLAEDDPPPLVAWLLHSHPPIRSRIELARVFERGAS